MLGFVQAACKYMYAGFCGVTCVPFCKRKAVLPSPGWPLGGADGGGTVQSVTVSGSFGPKGFSLAGRGCNWLSCRSTVKCVPRLPTYAAFSTSELLISR